MESEDVLVRVFTFLRLQDLASAARVCKKWHSAAKSEVLWKAQCESQFRLLQSFSFPVVAIEGDYRDPERPTFQVQELPSYRAAFIDWYSSIRHPLREGADIMLQARAQAAWTAIMPDYQDEDLLSLAEVRDFTLSMADAGPPTAAVIAYYLTCPRSSFEMGEYAFYSHHMRLKLISLEESEAYSRQLRRRNPQPELAKYVIFAIASVPRRLVLLELASGSLFTIRQRLDQACPLTPPGPAGDGVLRWLETYAALRLCGGFGPTRFSSDDPALVSLFPLHPSLCSVAVTRGVEITASPIFVPEASDDAQSMFAYSIRMRLLPLAEQHGAPTAECRLHSRAWRIRDATGWVEEVQGEGVVGLFPLLRAGEEPFVYESCSPLAKAPGTMEGHYVFSTPSGELFNARVAPFVLGRPPYVY